MEWVVLGCLERREENFAKSETDAFFVELHNRLMVVHYLNYDYDIRIFQQTLTDVQHRMNGRAKCLFYLACDSQDSQASQDSQDSCASGASRDSYIPAADVLKEGFYLHGSHDGEVLGEYTVYRKDLKKRPNGRVDSPPQKKLKRGSVEIQKSVPRRPAGRRDELPVCPWPTRRERAPEIVCPVSPTEFDEIVSGEKSAVVRFELGQFEAVRRGDTLVFTNGRGADAVRKVASCRRYKTVEALLGDVNVANIFPSKKISCGEARHWLLRRPSFRKYQGHYPLLVFWVKGLC